MKKIGNYETEKEELSTEAQKRVELLNQQILALRQQLSDISAALEIAEAKARQQDVQIAELGKRLNTALASKVQELARYRSEFFGRLREILGDREDIQIVGDRFVFRSDVFFDSGSAELGPRAATSSTCWRPRSSCCCRISRRRSTGCCASTATPTTGRSARRSSLPTGSCRPHVPWRS